MDNAVNNFLWEIKSSETVRNYGIKVANIVKECENLAEKNSTNPKIAIRLTSTYND